jgi:hypothetical protein
MKDDFVPLGSKKDQSIFGATSAPAATVNVRQAPQEDFVPLTQDQIQRPAPRDYTLSEIPLAAVTNLPRSAANFYGGIVDAVTSPIDTIKSVFQLGGGAALAALPKGAQDFLLSVGNDPAKMQESINMAKAAGGFYADRYGSAEGFKRAIAEDPVGVAADFSTILSGGAAATTRMPAVSANLQRAATLTNPVAPLTQVFQGQVPFTQRTIPEMVSQGAGAVTDIVSGNAGKLLASKIAKETLGPDNVPRARALTGSQFDNMTAGEAASAAGIYAPEFQALYSRVSGENPQFFGARNLEMESRRQGLLQAVTPDEAAARQARASATDPMFQAARDFNLPVNTTDIIKNIDDTLKANPGNKTLRSALLEVKKGVRKSKTAGELSSVVDGIKTQLASRDNKFVQGNLIDIREQINALIPGLGEARQTFAQMSAPVNQAQVLGEMSRRLTGPLDAERPGQFMRVLGEGEGALLKRSTGAPRFEQGDLMRLLTEEQGSAVTQVSDQLRQQANMARQSTEGSQALASIMERNQAIPQRVPNVLNRTIMVINRALALLSGNVRATTMERLDKAMRSGSDLNELLNAVPAAEKNAILQAISRAGSEISPDKLRNIGLIEQVTQQDESQIPRIELRNMAP